MKAIRIAAFGGPEVLTLGEVDRPAPAAGQALVRIAASGVNFMDVGVRRGQRGGETPLTPGGEAAGTVEAVGAGVTTVKPGDRVMYAMVTGSYAEFAVVNADRLLPVPDGMDLVQAAAIPLQGMTAHYLLHEYAKVGPGTTVLVHAVAGGMGLMLTRYATHLGAHVIGTTSSAEKAAKAKAAGAKDVILYTETDFAEEVAKITDGQGVNLILDAVGKATFAGDLKAIGLRGHIVVYGAASGPPDPIVPNSLMAKCISLSGGGLANFLRTREELERRANAVTTGLREGWLKLSIDRVLPLAQASEAHRLLESRTTSGKLLLTTGAA